MPGRAIPWRSRIAAAVIDRSPDWGSLAASRMMGAAARARIPRPISRAAISAYVRCFGVELRDVDPVRHAEGYESFDAFFTRPLRSGVRPVARSASKVVSPCDGLIRDVVEVGEDAQVEVKGHAYGLGELLASDELAAGFVGGTATTIYLHPRDYHRVHCPCDALVTELVHVPGRLLPVTAAAIAREPGLFCRNERVVHVIETVHGKMAVVMIAAFGVGHMTCSYRHLGAHPASVARHRVDPPVRLRKADELGVFHLGSTVVVVAEPGLAPLCEHPPRRVRMGEAILAGGAPG